MDIIKNNKRPGAFQSGLILIIILGLGVVSSGVYLYYLNLYKPGPDFLPEKDIRLYIFLFLFLFILYLLSVFLTLKNRSKTGESGKLMCIILFFAVVFRLCLIPLQPTILSSDMYRYVWDGRVQQHGINPYQYPPNAEELKDLRDKQIYPNINRKGSPTIYPALAQISFRMIYTLAGDSIAGYKSAMVFFDILTLLLLADLLRAHGFERTRLIVYAWNPLVVFEIAYSGHLEGLTVFLIVSALYLNAIHKKIPGVIFLAFAAAVKLYPALLLPAVLNKGSRIKGLAVFFITFVLLYIPYITVGSKISGFLSVYLTNPYESFNLGLKALLMHLFPGMGYYMLSKLFMAALFAAGLVVFFKDNQGIEPLRYAYLLTGFLIILMPASLHPWYVVFIIPFLTFYPNIAWLIFTWAVTLSYLKYASPTGILPTWVRLTEYLPLFCLLAMGYILKRCDVRKRGFGIFKPEKLKTGEVEK